ncbi:protein trichome birefringence-like 26 [Oryza brachyantha]|uniref:Uncharacterized protein n=1 Tax=Oryza brachyantha TaxID=4533 RepID=J3M4Z5_ORYBR|nr:protein trichome birefringence-like 26 [Oryza brachyantha]
MSSSSKRCESAIPFPTAALSASSSALDPELVEILPPMASSSRWWWAPWWWASSFSSSSSRHHKGDGGWGLGGPVLVKAVGWLLVAGLFFRALCSFPSSSPEISKGKCNLFDGEWIPNPSGPAYTNKTCRFIDGHQNCMRNGRPDMSYLHWRWKPYECEMPQFDAVKFLSAMRNKSWGLIGDSILRNQIQSLICLLSEAEEPVQVYHDKEYRNRRWHFQSYNFTLSLIWSPFLIKSEVFENENGQSTAEIQLHLDVLDPVWTSQYDSFDYVVIAGGQWFLKIAVYWENGRVIGCHNCQDKKLLELGFEHLYRTTLQQVFRFITSANHKPVVLFRTWAPDHFENAEWFNGGSCSRVLPYKKGEYMGKDIDHLMRPIELEEFKKAIAGSRNAANLKLLDTYRLSSLRPDGHVGSYRYPFVKGDKDAKSVQNDCLHWCVPGPIDAWNDLVMKMVLN